MRDAQTGRDAVARHYSDGRDLADVIAHALRSAGRAPDALSPRDLATVDEFHIRGRRATLELGERLGLGPSDRVLDIGSGLGGPARTLAETRGCHVTGIDLSAEFCAAARRLTEWVGLTELVAFQTADATAPPFAEAAFDAALTVHVGMNIAEKDRLFAAARRVLKPGGLFAVYDALQGEGGDVLYPVPWARTPAISHLATPEEMRALLAGAGFAILEEADSTAESADWFAGVAERIAADGVPPVSFQLFLGDDFPAMTRNQVRNLAERRIRTVTYLCRA